MSTTKSPLRIYGSDSERSDNYNTTDDSQSELIYPDIELDEYTKLWKNNTIASRKDEHGEIMSNLKDQILGGSGSLAVTLALILTIAIPAILQNPSPNTKRLFHYPEACEAYHIMGWAITVTSSFIGIVVLLIFMRRQCIVHLIVEG